ncbi:MAG: glycosyltransferase [candidate division WOR-3 bacterium]|nr:glycosyltransferase [candidate division WOR-3 bacterium]
MVSFIIVNYNTKELTARAIDSICKSCQNGEFEIIVFDNASTDGSKEFFLKNCSM